MGGEPMNVLGYTSNYYHKLIYVHTSDIYWSSCKLNSFRPIFWSEFHLYLQNTSNDQNFQLCKSCSEMIAYSNYSKQMCMSNEWQCLAYAVHCLTLSLLQTLISTIQLSTCDVTSSTVGSVPAKRVEQWKVGGFQS